MESLGFTCKKQKIIPNLHVLGLFIPKKRNWSEKKFRLSCGLAVGFWTKFEAEKTQESKNLEISLQNFQKMIDCSKFGKRCLLGISIQNFILYSLRKS
jgi:hypothetical protein